MLLSRTGSLRSALVLFLLSPKTCFVIRTARLFSLARRIIPFVRWSSYSCEFLSILFVSLTLRHFALRVTRVFLRVYFLYVERFGAGFPIALRYSVAALGERLTTFGAFHTKGVKERLIMTHSRGPLRVWEQALATAVELALLRLLG